MARTSQSTNISFNVHCIQCGNVFSPRERTPLWWRAKQRADKGYLDALPCTEKDCGCERVEQKHEPDAPFRVSGFDMELNSFDVGLYTFSEAVKQFRHSLDNFCTVSIQGVSPSVQRMLELRH